MVDEIAPEELHDRLGEAGLQVIDVRDEPAFGEGHIPGAINVPLEAFARRIGEVEVAGEVVLVCPVGERSLQAGRLLESYAGVDDATRISHLAGGYAAWPYDLEDGG